MTDEQFEELSRELVSERHRREALTRKLNRIHDTVTIACSKQAGETTWVNGEAILAIIEAA